MNKSLLYVGSNNKSQYIDNDILTCVYAFKNEQALLSDPSFYGYYDQDVLASFPKAAATIKHILSGTDTRKLKYSDLKLDSEIIGRNNFADFNSQIIRSNALTLRPYKQVYSTLSNFEFLLSSNFSLSPTNPATIDTRYNVRYTSNRVSQILDTQWTGGNELLEPSLDITTRDVEFSLRHYVVQSSFSIDVAKYSNYATFDYAQDDMSKKFDLAMESHIEKSSEFLMYGSIADPNNTAALIPGIMNNPSMITNSRLVESASVNGGNIELYKVTNVPNSTNGFYTFEIHDRFQTLLEEMKELHKASTVNAQYLLILPERVYDVWSTKLYSASTNLAIPGIGSKTTLLDVLRDVLKINIMSDSLLNNKDRNGKFYSVEGGNIVPNDPLSERKEYALLMLVDTDRKPLLMPRLKNRQFTIRRQPLQYPNNGNHSPMWGIIESIYTVPTLNPVRKHFCAKIELRTGL